MKGKINMQTIDTYWTMTLPKVINGQDIDLVLQNLVEQSEYKIKKIEFPVESLSSTERYLIIKEKPDTHLSDQYAFSFDYDMVTFYVPKFIIVSQKLGLDPGSVFPSLTKEIRLVQRINYLCYASEYLQLDNLETELNKITTDLHRPVSVLKKMSTTQIRSLIDNAKVPVISKESELLTKLIGYIFIDKVIPEQIETLRNAGFSDTDLNFVGYSDEDLEQCNIDILEK